MAINGQRSQNFFLEGKHRILKNKKIRTDNAIKNHFYSKLRKFIRKILKSINKENLLRLNGIDPYKYNSDKIYRIIKKFKIPYNSLTKETMLQLVINYERNAKTGRIDGNSLLKNKTTRVNGKRKKKKDVLDNINIYSEKIVGKSRRENKQNIYKEYSKLVVFETRKRRTVKTSYLTLNSSKKNSCTIIDNNCNNKNNDEENIKKSKKTKINKEQPFNIIIDKQLLNSPKQELTSISKKDEGTECETSSSSANRTINTEIQINNNSLSLFNYNNNNNKKGKNNIF
jgi:hypothetical protein